MSALLLSVVAAPQDLVASRVWLERLRFVVPGTAATRWLLLADLACLVAIGQRARSRLVGVSVALIGGFVVLNLAGMVVTDFYLGLTLFHLVVGVTTAALLRRARWAGLALVALTLLLGALT